MGVPTATAIRRFGQQRRRAQTLSRMVVVAPSPRTPLSPDHALTAASVTSSWTVRRIGNTPKGNRALMVATGLRLTQRKQFQMVDRHRLIGECRKLKQDGVDLESVVAYLGDEGCWKIDSIAILSEVLHISFGDAKGLVHLSSTWRDTREQDDAFHDELIDALVEKPKQ